jgi:hypothetical protein
MQPSQSSKHDRQRIVLIASEAVLAAWSARRAPTGEVIGISDADPGALETITHRRPKMVVLEQSFTSTSRGAALVHRLQTDQAFQDVEVRALSQERLAQLPHLGTATSIVALTHRIQPRYRTARHAVRVKLERMVKAEIDGNPATLVDVSMNGAQVLTPSVLRPGQRVQMFLVAMRVGATIVWAAFERAPAAAAPWYRAGMEFSHVGSQNLDQLFWRLGLPSQDSH